VWGEVRRKGVRREGGYVNVIIRVARVAVGFHVEHWVIGDLWVGGWKRRRRKKRGLCKSWGRRRKMRRSLCSRADEIVSDALWDKLEKPWSHLVPGQHFFAFDEGHEMRYICALVECEEVLKMPRPQTPLGCVERQGGVRCFLVRLECVVRGQGMGEYQRVEGRVVLSFLQE
jgi:hypothetical protein